MFKAVKGLCKVKNVNPEEHTWLRLVEEVLVVSEDFT